MSDVIRFAVLGLGLGAMYALAAQGIVVIYRGSGVINFAQGAIGTAAAYLAWELQQRQWPFGPAFIAGVILGAAGILVTPVVGLQVTTLTSLVLAALAAALVGGFSSFPGTLGAGLLIGVITSELTRFTTVIGLPQAVPFFVIVVTVVVSGRAL